MAQVRSFDDISPMIVERQLPEEGKRGAELGVSTPHGQGIYVQDIKDLLKALESLQ